MIVRDVLVPIYEFGNDDETLMSPAFQFCYDYQELIAGFADYSAALMLIYLFYSYRKPEDSKAHNSYQQWNSFSKSGSGASGSHISPITPTRARGDSRADNDDDYDESMKINRKKTATYHIEDSDEESDDDDYLDS